MTKKQVHLEELYEILHRDYSYYFIDSTQATYDGIFCRDHPVHEIELIYWKIFPAGLWEYVQLDVRNCSYKTLSTTARPNSLVLPLDINTGQGIDIGPISIKFKGPQNRFSFTIYGEGLAGVPIVLIRCLLLFRVVN